MNSLSVLICFIVIITVNSCGVGPKADLRRFERDFRAKMDFANFTNAAINALKQETPDDRSRALEAINTLLPSLSIAPPKVGCNEVSKDSTKLIRVIYFDGLVGYEILVLLPGSTLPGRELNQGVVRQIADGVYVRRLNL